MSNSDHSMTRGTLVEPSLGRPDNGEHVRSRLERYLGVIAASEATHESRVPDTSMTDHATAGPSTSGTQHSGISEYRVRDVMTKAVISVPTTASFKQILEALTSHRISAVPVVDADGRVLGVVSESDLLAKVATAGARGTAGRMLHGGKWQKAGAETAGELMSEPAVTVDADSSVIEAARISARERVRRLPVIDSSGRLVGIVARGDLLRVFAPDDADTANVINRQILDRQFGIDPSTVNVTVRDGVVTLTGEIERRSLHRALVEAVRSAAGVVTVHPKLTYRVDDVPPPPLRVPLY